MCDLHTNLNQPEEIPIGQQMLRYSCAVLLKRHPAHPAAPPCLPCSSVGREERMPKHCSLSPERQPFALLLEQLCSRNCDGAGMASGSNYSRLGRASPAHTASCLPAYQWSQYSGYAGQTFSNNSTPSSADGSGLLENQPGPHNIPPNARYCRSRIATAGREEAGAPHADWLAASIRIPSANRLQPGRGESSAIGSRRFRVDLS